MMHVAFLNDVIPVSGGAERLLVQTLVALDGDRFQRTLIVTRWDPEVAASDAGAGVLLRLERAGVGVVGVRRTRRLSPRAWLTVVRHLRRERVDVLHSHKLGANLAAVVVGRLAGVPVVAHEHGLRTPLSPARGFADRRLIGSLAAVVLCVSEADHRRLVDVERLPAEKVRLVQLGIPARETEPASRPVSRRALGLPADGVVVVATAALRPEKRLDVLLDALAELRSAGVEITAVLMGDGPEREALEAQAERLGLGARARFLGNRTDVQDVLAAADIGVLCSDREGTPLAVLEYMQAGCGIVATSVGGVPAVIRHEREGLLVAPGSPGELAQALGRLSADTDLRETLGRAARERCLDRFGLDRFIRTLADLYRSLAGSGANG